MLGLRRLFRSESGKPKMPDEDLGGKILLVNYDSLVGRDLEAIYKLRLSCNTDVVTSVDEAIKLMKYTHYDVCVLDPFGQVNDLVGNFIKESAGCLSLATRIGIEYGKWWDFVKDVKKEDIPVHIFSMLQPDVIERDYMLRQGRDYESRSFLPVRTANLLRDVRDIIVDYKCQHVAGNSL
ncbi:hypothetical protein GOV12_05975 [Candidatus Pacearchaeota archaeon]|nr:hypothetical protein [Candidatus Pacearchaeota archaeon]